jgi:hypothetical protein
MIPELSDEENVRLMIEHLGVGETVARFIVAMERGETDGDLVAVDGPLTPARKRRVGLGRPIGDHGIRFAPIEEDE